MSLRIGVDVGGTFTDVFMQRDDEVYRGKSDTTHYDLKVGFMNAARSAVERFGSTLEDALRSADSIVYSTTVGTNALIERKGSKLGLITTKGFEDTVYVGRSRNWADGLSPETKYDRGRAQRPVPIIPGERIVGVQERIDNLGRVVAPIRDDDILEKVQYLVDQGVRGFVVVTLNSFVNPVHEQRVRDVIRRQYPESYLGHMPVYLSSEISPQSGEYRRSMTVILDAYLREITEEHLLRLTEDLRDLGYHKPFFVAKNTGGVSSLSRSQALHLYGSSPSATVVGADHLGKQVERHNVLIADMGGTSFDVGLVVEGRDRVHEYDPIIDRYRVQIPFVAHWSIGAGGGSIAHVENGVLKVGPESAGSNPGPACYARGGESPTVTDADVVLGYIDPGYFLGGRIRLDEERSRRAIEEKVARPLGLSIEEAAWNIKKIVDGFMGQEMYRICALISGQDPREFAVFALGGAGAVHATGFSDFADVKQVATFPFGSVFGAFSTLSMDILQSYEKTAQIGLFAWDEREYLTDSIPHFNEEVRGLLEAGREDMLEEGFDLDTVRLQLEVHMSYGQQRHSIPIIAPKTFLETAEDVKQLCDMFNEAYGANFGKGAVYPEAGIEVVQLRLSATGPLPKFRLGSHSVDGDASGALKGRRQVYWGPDAGYVETPVYQREKMGAGAELAGPILCESEDTVTVVPRHWRFRTDEYQVGWIEKI
ncbi:hydantoinase/oxoprolinase family protein [Rubrobacter marinus]|uniref:Hydantoinase/oxoprolinase family protein n=1 Tax=Rubrobacter marinus TaxID=2653852 RepID=A0A6G8Q0Z7_9ACTN|nr:hydantoinase/oxoprolinase family protein [Rubrobacter marinus]QIN79987.1 hydantoinase/oxoprolinase family protein [Rubrobacter marinus]